MRSISIARPTWSRLPRTVPTQLRYGGNRSILLNAAEDIPGPELRHCVALALTYHLRKRKTANGSS